jgi:hypothetical protein
VKKFKNQMVQIRLSSEGLTRSASITEKDFVFILNELEVPCTKSQAAFISPAVHSLLRQDRTVNSFRIDCQADRTIFEFFEQLMNGFSIEPNREQLDGVLEIASLLGNVELLSLVLEDDSPLSLSNVCGRIRNKSVLDRAVDKEIEFAASHFHELDRGDLKGLEISLLERIVSSASLQLTNEDSLFSFICTLDRNRTILLRHVMVEYLSHESMETFVTDFQASDLDPLIWSAICRRLILPVSPKCDQKSRFLQTRRGPKHSPEEPAPSIGEEAGWVTFPMTEKGSLDGIISYLTKKHRGNVHERGVVAITSKSIFRDRPRYLVQNLADLKPESFFLSNTGVPDQWVCWDFKERRVRLTHYAIKASLLLSCLLEGSMDGENWTEIDRQCEICQRGLPTLDWIGRDMPVYCNDFVTLCCEVSAPMEARFIRLTQNDKNTGGGDYMVVMAVEFFGKITE